MSRRHHLARELAAGIAEQERSAAAGLYRRARVLARLRTAGLLGEADRPLGEALIEAVLVAGRALAALTPTPLDDALLRAASVIVPLLVPHQRRPTGALTLGVTMDLFIDPMNHYTLDNHHKPGLQRIYDAFQFVAETLDREIGPTTDDRKRRVADELADARAGAVRCYLMTHGVAKPPSASGF